MKIVWAGFVLTLFLGSFLEACSLNDDDNFGTVNVDGEAVATILPVEDDEKDFYFLLDGGQKLYPSDKRGIAGNYDWKKGQRVHILFNLLEQKIPGYEYNGQIVYLFNILTKDVIPLTEDTADSIGDDRIDITAGVFGNKHLNIYFRFRGTENPNKVHMVNLVRNETKEGITEEGDFLVLEFRHNAYNDYQSKTLEGNVSFRLPFTEEEFNKYKGVKVRTNTYNGIINQNLHFDNSHIKMKR